MKTSHLVPLVAGLVAAGADPAPFDTEITFYSKGTRGMKHSDRYCSKATVSYYEAHETTESLLTAKSACSRCLEDSIGSRLNEVLREAGRSYQSIKIALRTDTVNDSPVVAAENLTIINQLLAELRKLEQYEELASYVIKQTEKLLVRRAQMQEKMDGASGILVRMAILALIRGGKSTAPLAEPGELIVFGTREDDSHPVWTAWQREMTSSADLSIARAQAVARARRVRLFDMEQLKVPLLPAEPGENTHMVAERSWVARRDDVTSTLCDRWEVAYADLASDMTVSLVAVALSDAAEGMWSSMLSTFTVATSGTKVVMAAPAPVVTWASRAHRRISRYFEQVEIPTGVTTEQLVGTAEVAATLWNPYDTGSIYNSFASAHEASVAV